MLAGEYPPLWGGLGSATYHLCKFLSEMGHEITIITRSLKNGKRPEIKNVNIIEVNWLYAPMAFTRSYGKNAIKALKKVNSNKSIDIIHLHCPLIALTEKEILSLRENIAPVISSLHGSWLGERDGIIAARKHKESAVWKNPNDLAILFTAKYYSKYETAAAKASNICVANSEATKNDFCTRYSLSNDWNCEVIHWGIDESLFRPIDYENEDDKSNYKLAREEFLFEEDGLLLLAVGRLAARKGFRFLLKSMPLVLEKFPKATLLIIGRGSMYKTLNKQAKKLGISDSIKIESGMEFEHLAIFYRSADLVIYPSYYEGQGLIPLEAMASGTPIITVNDGPLPEMVDESVGALYQPGDIEDLSEKIIEELSNPDLRRLQSINGRKRILNEGTFTQEKTAKKFEELYKKMIQ
ncbi:MAG: glycosyltransferase family 4 protein [Candidatus Thermoplasmatota archaeon]|nr:glycosyltransferase family 4 protein [Candidatus Thermoplasmatota archaeon]